ADGADGTVAAARTDRVCRIFEHHQVVTAGDVHDRVHIARFAGEVDGHDDLRARADSALDRFGVDVGVVGADVGEDRVRAGVDDDVRGRGEGVGGRDDFVAGADVPRAEGEVHG